MILYDKLIWNMIPGDLGLANQCKDVISRDKAYINDMWGCLRSFCMYSDV